MTEKELYNALIDIDNNKSPGNRKRKRKKVLSISQRQAIIKLIEKPNKDKRFIENWRPISLLNVDQKIISKALASRLKKCYRV